MSEQRKHLCQPDPAASQRLDEAYANVDGWRSSEVKLYKPSGANVVHRHGAWQLVVDEYYVAVTHCPFCGRKLELSSGGKPGDLSS